MQIVWYEEQRTTSITFYMLSSCLLHSMCIPFAVECDSFSNETSFDLNKHITCDDLFTIFSIIICITYYIHPIKYNMNR